MMSGEHDDDGPERFRAYVEAKQRNIDWPDTLRNSSSVDGFLWKGSKHLTGVQRAGLWIFGIFFLFASVGLALTAWEQHAGLALLPVAFGLFIAARLIRNACRQNSPRPRDEEL
jgi:hypothetical protein